MSFMTKSCGEGVYVSLAMNTEHVKITADESATVEAIKIARRIVEKKKNVTFNIASPSVFQRCVNVFCDKEHGALGVTLCLPTDDQQQQIRLHDIVLFLGNFPHAQEIQVACVPLRYLTQRVAQHFVDVVGPNLVTLSMRGPCPAINIAPYECKSDDGGVHASFEPRAGLRVERRNLIAADYRATDARIDALILRLDAAPSTNVIFRR